MKCEKAQELFSDHLEIALERPMVVAFERHLAECSACQHDYTSFKTTWQMLEMLPTIEPPKGFACDVVMEARMRREAERRAQTGWQRVFSEMFTSKLASRALATGFAVILAFFLSIQVIVHTPLRGIIGAWLVAAPRADVGKVAQQPGATGPAMAWLKSGLSFAVDSSGPGTGTGVFRLVLTPKDASAKRVRVYLMESWSPRFDEEGFKQANLVFEDDIGPNGQVIPFVIGRSREQQVVTAVIEWEHESRKFLEAVFVPTQVGQRSHGVSIRDADLYSALQEVSAAFGTMILVNADIKRAGSGINVESNSVEDAFYGVLKDSGLMWRPLSGSEVYIVERKIE
ncbi:MAG: zf-HC2 domain-containing protein [Armatimonadetes bacterium]|nr:zf-HC2 domain-containing protein [Armatimonadota bacterium]